jgi:hypothetical protein
LIARMHPEMHFSTYKYCRNLLTSAGIKDGTGTPL